MWTAVQHRPNQEGLPDETAGAHRHHKTSPTATRAVGRAEGYARNGTAVAPWTAPHAQGRGAGQGAGWDCRAPLVHGCHRGLASLVPQSSDAHLRPCRCPAASLMLKSETGARRVGDPEGAGQGAGTSCRFEIASCYQWVSSSGGPSLWGVPRGATAAPGPSSYGVIFPGRRYVAPAPAIVPRSPGL